MRDDYSKKKKCKGQGENKRKKQVLTKYGHCKPINWIKIFNN